MLNLKNHDYRAGSGGKSGNGGKEKELEGVAGAEGTVIGGVGAKTTSGRLIGGVETTAFAEISGDAETATTGDLTASATAEDGDTATTGVAATTATGATTSAGFALTKGATGAGELTAGTTEAETAGTGET